MNKRSFLAFLLLLFCLSHFLSAGGKKEKEPVIEITGKVRLVGSGPMTELVITGQDAEWVVSREEEHKLKNHQQRTVIVQGSETVYELKFANGMPAGQQRIIKNIKILSIH